MLEMFRKSFGVIFFGWGMIALFFITVLSILLRCIGIVKPDGLWNDEYVSWQIASTSFNDGFIQAMLAQCHMPLYYLYLKMCMAIGGSSDTFLRITSLVPGILSVIVMYYVGLQNNKKTGVVAALITAISSFLIYYSQEVRLYSLLFLFSALALLYFLKYIKNRSWVNLFGLLLFDFIIMFTHTIGFVFVFFELLVLSVLMFKEAKRQIVYFWSIGLILFLVLLPNIYHILTVKTFSQWWGVFSLSKLGFLFTDYFSPVLTNLVNAPDKLFYSKSLGFLFFAFVPTLIALSCIIRAMYKNKQNILLFLLCVGVVAVMSAAALMGKLVFITKYSIEIYPILIFLMAFGVSAFDKKFIGNILISLFCIINLFYVVASPNSAPKMQRTEGHKIVANLINHADINKGDVIFLQYYDENRFSKYFDFSEYQVVSVNKGNFNEYLSSDISYKKAYSDGKQIYKSVFSNSGKGYFEYKLKKDILDKLAEGQSVVMIINDSVAFYNTDMLSKISNDNYIYEKVPLLFMIFSYVSNHSFAYLSENLSVSRMERSGSWSLIKFTKLKDDKK